MARFKRKVHLRGFFSFSTELMQLMGDRNTFSKKEKIR